MKKGQNIVTLLFKYFSAKGYDCKGGGKERKLQECYLRKSSSGTKDIIIVVIVIIIYLFVPLKQIPNWAK